MILFTDGRHDVEGVPTQRGSKAHRSALRRSLAVRAAARRHGPGRGGSGRTDRRPRGPARRPGHASVRQRDDVRMARGRVRLAGAAGNAVAEALQAATCTFTVAPTEPPVTPAPPAAPGVVGNIRLTPGDGFIDWAGRRRPRERMPSPTTAPDAPATTGRSRPPRACRRNRGLGSRDLSRAASTAARSRRSPLPVKATGSRHLELPPARDPASAGHLERDRVQRRDRGRRPSPRPASRSIATNLADGGTTWEESPAITSASTSARIRDLTNGPDYVCRAFASNAVGVSDASALSDVVRPCSGLLDCNPLALPIVVGTVSLLSLGILLALFGIYRERSGAT